VWGSSGYSEIPDRRPFTGRGNYGQGTANYLL
jgi:hypothetical protein